MRHARTLIGPSLALSAVLLAGCAGNGRYTTEGKNLATLRNAQLKSATEWSMAHQAFLAGDLERALKRIDQSIAINPTAPKSHVLRGRILAERGQLGPALEALKEAQQLDPGSFEACYYQGVVYERLTQYERALGMYRQADQLDTTNPQYAVAAAEMLIELGRLDEAEAYLLGMNDRFEHAAGVRQTLGHIAMLRGEPTTAVTLFSEARLLAPDDQSVVEDLIDAQIKVGNFAEAEFSLGVLLRSDANASRRDLKHMRARCLVELDRPMEARELLLDLTKSPDGDADVEAWLGLGRVSFALGDTRNARRAATRLTGLAPRRNEGYLLRALLDRDANRRHDALTALDQALRISPDDASVLTMRGLVLSELGRHDEAAASLRRAVTIDPANGSAQRLLAMVEPAAVAGADDR
ncbi:MAG: tetratricopeptide repeat protein [Phycisphaeraceae bacterium]|nr:tetratricopeptide repeat protein [Phycisphaeraceae bacterium]MCW5754587.1 tetratricopeptide repeat protein [Phycisphaeraceae bacterium]